MPNRSGQIAPSGGGVAPTVITNDQRGAHAPPVEMHTDVRGVVTATICEGGFETVRDGSLNQAMGLRRQRIARG